LPKRLFTPSARHVPSAPRVDTGHDLRDVLAVVTLHAARATTELVVGLDLGRVIRVVATRELPARARKQLAFHERTRPHLAIHADELYVMDVQTIEYRPDAPGADDPMLLHGVLRGPYPHKLVDGVSGIEGQLATSRGPLLDGLAFGLERAFLYEAGYSGKTCTHVALPIDGGKARSLVLAFPLVPMGDDGSNELVVAHLIRGVLGAMRTDLGDDLARDPVPVPDRRRHERELIAAGWKIKGERAVHRRGRGLLASLFLRARKQKLPPEIPLAEYAPLIAAQLARVPGWSEAERRALRLRLGLIEPVRPASPPPQPVTMKRPPPAIPSNTSSANQKKRKNKNRKKIRKQNDLREKQRVPSADGRGRRARSAR
jgi:hypothetical protein